MEIRKTYQYRLYHNTERNQHLHQMIDIAGIIWNHITALQKRYYRLFGKHTSMGRMKAHVAKLRMKTQKYAYWLELGSQTVQDVCERHERTYQRFFNKQGGLPRFKKVKKYRSFTLKQAGWSPRADKREPVRKAKGKGYQRGIGVIEINGQEYQYVKHRPMNGMIKTVTVKRDTVGRLWLFFSVVETFEPETEASTGQIGGFDFGLKTFLTNDVGQEIVAPLFFKQDLPRLRQIQRQVSKKVKGSHNQQKGLKHLARRHIRIVDKRLDFHYQLAHDLCDKYDVLVFENLNLEGMKRLWGRKVSDLGFAQFLEIVKWVAFKRGKQVIQIGRWDRTTGKCSACGHEQNMDLVERVFCCQNPKCGLCIGRDHNSAINIRELGHQLILSQSAEDLAIWGSRR